MHLYGLIIGISIIIGLNYFEKHNRVVPKNKIGIFEFGLIFFAILGARIYHVLDQWSFYSQNLSLIPQTWNGGLGIFGGILGALFFVLVFVDRKSYFKILDSITPILPLCQAIGRLGNFVNHENPAWWSEAILNLFLFFIIRSKTLKCYSPTAIYLIGYGTTRFFTEFWRNDTWIIYYLKIGQIISIIFIIVGLFILNHDRSKVSKNNTQQHHLVS